MSRSPGHSIDDYLEIIYFLVSPIGELTQEEAQLPIAARVAELLGISRPATGEMLKRMTVQGLLEPGERVLRLTPAGMQRAEHVVRRHRIIERFLTDFLGYSSAEAHDNADALGDTFDDDMVERLNERLGFPDRCPHGWPVQPDDEREENLLLRALAEMPAGDKGKIVRLAEHDGDLLHWFYDEGFVPGSDIAVSGVHPAAGHLQVQVNGTEHLIAEKAARSLFVLPA